MTPVRRGNQLPAQTGDASAAETKAVLAQAVACAKRGEVGQAEKLIRQVLARDPHHPFALFELGRVTYLAGNKKAAADYLQKAIAGQPDNGQFHNELGFVLIGLGERQQAHRAFMRALEINPR